MKIVFLDEETVGGVDLTPIKRLGDYTGYSMTYSEEIIDRAYDAEVIVVNKVLLMRDTLAELPNLRLICLAATGMNNIDLDAAQELRIEVRNAAGYSTHSVAEATLSSALALRRQIPYYDSFVKSGDYSLTDRIFNFARDIGELHGSRWGIIGMGAIGREVARLATAFGCEVLYYSTSGVAREEKYPRAESLEELLRWCDTLSIHSPLNERTRALIGSEQLEMLSPHSIVVNVARGGIVDERALAEALNSGKLAGAAVDVFATEPAEEDNPLLAVSDPDRLLLSPHTAWQSRPALARLIEIIAKNIKTFYN